MNSAQISLEMIILDLAQTIIDVMAYNTTNSYVGRLQSNNLADKPARNL